MISPHERILVVENDPDISDLISRQILVPMGYRIEVVGAAAQAIQAAVRFSPDVILANLQLAWIEWQRPACGIILSRFGNSRNCNRL